MKKFFLLLFAALMTVTAASAQLRFGVKAGVNLDNLRFNEDIANFGTHNGCGFTGGVMVEATVPIVGICFDASLMYTRMTGDPATYVAMTDGSGYDTPAKISKDFLNIPVNIKYKFNIPVVASIIKPYLFTGPDFAFKLGGKDDVFKTKTFQCAWNIGLGVELINHLQISGSYGFGMNNVMGTIAGVNTSNDIKLKNNYWTITAAYLF